MGIVWPKLFARLCVAQKKFVTTIATQNGFVATLCNRSYLRDFVWPKKSFLRPLRLKMGMLQHCATEIICTTLCDPKKSYSNHCDSKWVCSDIVRPKLFARLCVAQKKFVATIATQNGNVQTFCDRSYLRDFVWTKKSLLRPLRLKMGMVCCDIVQSKLFARLCVAKKKLLRPLRLKLGVLRLCATEDICATLCGPKKVCCDHCESKWVLCDRSYLRDFVWPKKSLLRPLRQKNRYIATLCERSYLRDFVWPKNFFLRPLRLKMGIVRPKLFARLCVAQKKFVTTIATKKSVYCDIVRPKLFARLCATQKKFAVTIATQNGYVATLCDWSYLREFVWPKKIL